MLFLLEHLDFMNQNDLSDEENAFAQINHEYIGYQSLTDVPKAQTYTEEKITVEVGKKPLSTLSYYYHNFKY